MKDRNN